MTFEELIAKAHEQTPYLLDKILERDGQGKGWVCPICNNGTGATGDGLKQIPSTPHKLKCFKCDFVGDIIDIIGATYKIDGITDQLKYTADLMGVNLEPTFKKNFRDDFKDETQPNNNTQYNTQQKNDNSPVPQQEEETDYTEFFNLCNGEIDSTTYHRGLSLETLNEFNIGYCEEWKHPKSPNAPATPRLIIPTSKYSYIARDTRDEIPPNQVRYSKSKVGKVHIFNADALYNTTRPAIYITEGEIDALSIIEVGGEAVATGSTANTKKLLDLLKDKPPVAPLIIAMDNDDAGKKATEKLTKGLEELGLEYYAFNINGEYKDSNEALNQDRGIFTLEVVQGELTPGLVKEYEKDRYIKETSTAKTIEGFIDRVKTTSKKVISTGFTDLDEKLEGGLYEGLYIIGAISSLGKTTFTLQLADQIAKQGQDILIFSLEMSKDELIAKSLSRNTCIDIIKHTADHTAPNFSNAKTVRGIMDGTRYSNYNQDELDLINNAVMTYKRYANHLFIVEGQGNIGVEQIRETINKHINFTGNTPVVIVDYLQLLAPYNDKATEKQNTDKAVLELKRLSRDNKTPIIAISSFNRDNYNAQVNMGAFKESGGIEYSSDVLIGLQLRGVGKKEFSIDEAKAKNPREIELVILKNRNGRAGVKAYYDYYPLFNYFEETDQI